MPTLTREDIANLASRLKGHARLLPRASERRDARVAAAALHVITTMGFPVGAITVPEPDDDPPSDLPEASRASHSS